MKLAVLHQTSNTLIIDDSLSLPLPLLGGAALYRAANKKSVEEKGRGETRQRREVIFAATAEMEAGESPEGKEPRPGIGVKCQSHSERAEEEQKR